MSSSPTDQPVDLVVAGGRLVSEQGVVEAALAVKDGVIVALGDLGGMPAAAARIDAKGLDVLPGLIDPHVHLRDPGHTHKEDWTSGTRAAAAGGVTTVLDMPNTMPPTASVAALEAKLALAGTKAHVDFGAYALLAEDLLGALEGLVQAGAIGAKLYLGPTTGDLKTPNDGAILEGFETLARLGLRCAVHAENGAIIAWREARLRAAGRADPLAHLAARPEIAEIEALGRALVFAEWTGCRLHIAHVSAAADLGALAAAKARGVDVTAETCPHYLFLAAEEMAGAGGQLLRVNPPLRAAANQAPLWQALKDGLIDMIATDHAPHLPAEKHGAGIWECACGLPGLETMLPLLLNEVAGGRLSLPQLARIGAAAPARAFGLYPKKGVLAVGSDADLVLVDGRCKGTLGQGALQTRAQWTPFAGRRVTGAPVMTLVRGQIVMRDGEIVGPAGLGRPVRPRLAQAAPRHAGQTLAASLDPAQRPF